MPRRSKRHTHVCEPERLVCEPERLVCELADALANALDDYALLAEPHREAMDGLGGFDGKMIDEAKVIAERLRNRPPSAAEASAQSREALVRRNKLANLMGMKIALVRTATKFVFRGQPAIIKKATSAYERRRRAEAARAAFLSLQK